MNKFAMMLLPMLVLLGIGGCSKPDTDVTSSPKYGFATFSGTVWKTKVKLAVAELKDYRGLRGLNLLAPEEFDATNPKYNPPADMKEFSVLPEGTQVQIDRLMQDNGSWGGVRVTARLGDGRQVFLDQRLIDKNKFIWRGWSSATTWDVNHELLEK